MRTIILVAALLAVSPSPAVAQDAGRKRVRSTDVSLVPPRDFREAQNFNGFENPQAQASIMVTVLRGGIGQFIVGMTDERMKAKGMTVLSRQKLQVDRMQGLLMGIAQDADGRAWRKWMLVFGDSAQTALVVATFPKDKESSISRSIKDAVISARFGARGADFGEERPEDPAPAEPAAKKLENVPFKLTPAAPLKIADVLTGTILLTRTGRYPIVDPGDPFFVAGKAVAAVSVSDRKTFAKERLKKTAAAKEITVETVKAVTIDGLPGIEIVAKAKHHPSGTLLVLYQVMLFTEDSYYLLQGMGLENADPGFLAPFRKTARSFRR